MVKKRTNRRALPSPRAKQVKTSLKNIAFLIDGNGKVSLGRIGPVRRAGVASDDDQQLVALVRRQSESLEGFLRRLDAAIGRAWRRMPSSMRSTAEVQHTWLAMAGCGGQFQESYNCGVRPTQSAPSNSV